MAGVQQAITWASSDPVLYRYVVSLGHNKLSRCLGLFVFLFNLMAFVMLTMSFK